MSQTDGIYGGRFSGAGFKGCCLAIIDPMRADQVLAHVEEKYLKTYPGLRGKFMSAVCSLADGVGARL